jgi:hypothetical protein
VQRVSYPEPATTKFQGSPYETWCRQRGCAKVLVRSRGQGSATILWDALPVEFRIGDGWADETDRVDLVAAIRSATLREYAVVGGLFVGYVDLRECSFTQVAAAADAIAGVLDERFGVQRAA